MASNSTSLSNSTAFDFSFFDTIYIVSGTLVLLLNMAVIRVYIQLKSLFRNTRNLFLISSFIDNLIGGISLYIYGFYNTTPEYKYKCVITGSVLYTIFVYVVITHLNIAIDRLIAIKHYFIYRKYFTRVKTIVYIFVQKAAIYIFIFIVVATTSDPVYMKECRIYGQLTAYELRITLSIVYFVTIIVTVYIYIAIYSYVKRVKAKIHPAVIELRNCENNMQVCHETTNINRAMRKQNTKPFASRTKILKFQIVMFIIGFIAWFPFSTVVLYEAIQNSFHIENERIIIVRRFLLVPILLYTLVTPIAYTYKVNKVKYNIFKCKMDEE